MTKNQEEQLQMENKRLQRENEGLQGYRNTVERLKAAGFEHFIDVKDFFTELENCKKQADTLREAIDQALQEVTESRELLAAQQKELDRFQEKIKEANKLLYSDKPDGEILGALMELFNGIDQDAIIKIDVDPED